MTVSLRRRNQAVMVFMFFVWGSLSLTIGVQATHDVEVALDYRPGENQRGIVIAYIVDNMSCEYILNDSSGLTNLTAGRTYRIGYKIRNKVAVMENIFSCLKINNSTTCLIYEKCRCWGCEGANNSNDTKTYLEYWNTSNLSLGLYDVVVEAQIINTSTWTNITDADPSDNIRTRTIRLVDEQPPVWVENPSNQIIEKNQPFRYDVNATDNIQIDKYSINGSLFEINETSGIITNKTALKFKIYHLNITVNDSSGNSLSSKIKITVTDLTPPQLTIHNPINQTYNQTIPVNLTAFDTLSNLSTIWYTKDNQPTKHNLIKKINQSKINHSSNITTLSGGKHTIVFHANDSYGNTAASDEINLYVYANVNAKEFIQELKQVKYVKTASLLDALNNTINYSINESIPINKSYSLILILNHTKTKTTIRIPSFQGINLNWNQNNLIEILNLSDLNINEVENQLGVKFKTLLYLNNTEKLLANADYLAGAVIWMDENPIEGLQLAYLVDDEITPYILKKCDNSSGPATPITTDNMCYYNTTKNTTIWVPHLSGLALLNDTTPPKIEIIKPENNTIINDSKKYFFNFRVTELNPNPDGFCRYIINSSENLIADGTYPPKSMFNYTITFWVYDLLNGSYNFTVNCTDLYGKSTQVKHIFTVHDIIPPVILDFDIDEDYNSDRTSARLYLTAKTDEKSTCRYDTKDKQYSKMEYELTADSAGKKHTTRHSKKYTKDTSGRFYVRCIDLNGVEVLIAERGSYSVNIREEEDDDDDSSSSSSSSLSSSSSDKEGSCFDYIENCHDGDCEDGIDCGGPCMPCASCSDNKQNQGETGIDCGGPCPPCKTSTSSTTSSSTTTSTSSSTTTSTSSTSTTTVQKIVYIPANKKTSESPTGMITGNNLFNIIISAVVLLVLLLMGGLTAYAYMNKGTLTEDKPVKKRPYELESKRKGTRLGDV